MPSTGKITIADVNRMTDDAFRAAFGGIFEHSPWVAARACTQRPFASADALHAAMMAVVARASDTERLALLRAHPELAGREAQSGGLGASSSSEQDRLGFTALSREELLHMAAINRAYREKFGFPAIVALALHTDRESVMRLIEARTGNEVAAEIEQAIAQIGHITRARLAQIVP